VVSADVTSTNAGDVYLTETGGITLTDVTTADGLIDVSAGGLVTVENVDSSGTDDDANGITIATTVGNIEVDTITTGGTAGDVTLTANTAGGQSVTDGDGNSMVTAEVLTIEVQGSVGTAGNRLTTTAVSADITSTNAGDVYLTETGGITLTDVTTADGLINVSAAGLVTVENVDSSGTDDDANDITIATTVGNIEVDTITTGGTAGDVTTRRGRSPPITRRSCAHQTAAFSTTTTV